MKRIISFTLSSRTDVCLFKKNFSLRLFLNCSYFSSDFSLNVLIKFVLIKKKRVYIAKHHQISSEYVGDIFLVAKIYPFIHIQLYTAIYNTAMYNAMQLCVGDSCLQTEISMPNRSTICKRNREASFSAY